MTIHRDSTRRQTISGIAPRMQRLLVVDDEPLAVEALALVMADVSDVRATTDPKEALAWVAAGERFDALLVDVMMPVMNGLELRAEIDAIAPGQAARVIFMTAGVAPSLREELARLNNACLDKPLDIDELRCAVRADDVRDGARQGDRRR